MVIRQSGTSHEISKKDTLMRGYPPQPIDVLRPSVNPVVELEAKDGQQPQSYPERPDDFYRRGDIDETCHLPVGVVTSGQPVVSEDQLLALDPWTGHVSPRLRPDSNRGNGAL
jgi:hypothetical protein